MVVPKIGIWDNVYTKQNQEERRYSTVACWGANKYLSDDFMSNTKILNRCFGLNLEIAAADIPAQITTISDCTFGWYNQSLYFRKRTVVILRVQNIVKLTDSWYDDQNYDAQNEPKTAY
jgi:hypothetical protein